MFYIRLSVLLLPVFLYLSSQSIVFFPKSFFPIVLISLGLIIYWTFLLFKKKKNKELGRWWEYSLLPVVFYLSSIFYFSIEPNLLIGQFVLLLTAFFLFNYFKNLYYSAVNSENRENQLKNISFFGGVLAVFFSANVSYGLKVFLGYPLLPTFLGLSLFLFGAWYQIFVFISSSLRKNLLFFFVALLLLLQFGAVLFFLPFSYHLLAIMMTIYFYFIVGVGRFYLQGTVPDKQFRFYLLFSVLATLILILTARWL